MVPQCFVVSNGFCLVVELHQRACAIKGLPRLVFISNVLQSENGSTSIYYRVPKGLGLDFFVSIPLLVRVADLALGMGK